MSAEAAGAGTGAGAAPDEGTGAAAAQGAGEAAERELAPSRVAELESSGQAQLVDVRRDEEYEAGRIAGALHIPFDDLPARAAELDRSRPLVFYCRSGDRSASAADAFAASGWDAHSMAGGLTAWAEAGLPLDPEDGEVGSPSNLPPA